jgi:cytochrome c-type biogenesis protein CcmE
MLAAVLYLVFSGMSSGAQYFITVDELLTGTSYAGQTVRISGAVIGSTIDYESDTLTLDFTIVNIPKDTTNLAETLHRATLDRNAKRLKVHLDNIVKPDLLKNEAQAILTGTLGHDGVFYGTELLLKCPSRYEEDVPDQTISQSQGSQQ